MRVNINNIGKIKEADIDFSKNLIVFTGKNNSGKTWVSYVLYSLLKNKFKEEPLFKSKYINRNLFFHFEDGINEKELVIDKKELMNHLNKLLTSFLKLNLPLHFANSKIDFNKFKISISGLNILKDKILIVVDKTSGFEKEMDKTKVTFSENEKEIILNISKETDAINKLISKKYKVINIIQSSFFDDSLLFNEINPVGSLKFIPAERVGISIFSTDISANRIENNNGIDYQLPIKDALQDWIRIPKVVDGSNKNIFFTIAEQIEKEILGGDLFIGEGGSVQYKIDENQSLSYYNTASNIKSLSSLIFYLKYYCHEGGTLFIDEPELNLHPDNQRKIAKILAKISNLGVKVIVSTHSDYIIREFNNLIMLSKNHKKANVFMKQYNYLKDEVLKVENVSAYYFDKGKANELIVTETGFDVVSIDETIELQNEISNKLYFSLFDN